MKYLIRLVPIYTIKLCRLNPDFLFIFGDNTERIGIGGQAIIREEKNSFGIATKKNVIEFWRDIEYAENVLVIESDIENLKKYYEEGDFKGICFPTAGIGWGRSEMQKRCPLTALYLCRRLLEEFEYNNLADLVNLKRF